MIRARQLGPLIALAALVAALDVAAQELPVPSWVRSVEVVRPGATIRSRPTTESARRGTVRVGTRLAMRGRVMGSGCPGGEWIRSGDEAFICETLVRYSPHAPAGEDATTVPEGQLTPRTHAFVRTDGTW